MSWLLLSRLARACLAWLTLAGVPAALQASEAFLIGAGDIAKCGKRLKNAEATAELLDEFFAAHQDAEASVFTVGDNVYPRGRTREFLECYEPTWGRHKDRTRPAVGNHEYKTSGARPYFNYFGPAAGEPGKGYYSYDLGDWHIVVLNSVCKKVDGGCDKGSPQQQWMEEDLKANPSRCTLAYFHHPLFSSGKHGTSKRMRLLFETLHEHGVDVILSGHDHNYERFAPQDIEGNHDPEGIRQFVVGTGGREIRRIGRPERNSEARGRDYGVLKLTLKPETYEWEFLPVEGGTFRDAGSGACH